MGDRSHVRGVNPVGDMADRHVRGRMRRPEGVPHLPRDLFVTSTHGVHRTARAECQSREPRPRRLIVARGPSEGEQVGPIPGEITDPSEHPQELVSGVRLVSRGHGGVRGEDDSGAHRLPRLVGGHA